MQLTETQADAIYNILVECCGADDDSKCHYSERGCFISSIMAGSNEYRFCGNLGFGGKFRNNTSIYVDYYPEHKTPERDAAVKAANDKLNKLFQ